MNKGLELNNNTFSFILLHFAAKFKALLKYFQLIYDLATLHSVMLIKRVLYRSL